MSVTPETRAAGRRISYSRATWRSTVAAGAVAVLLGSLAGLAGQYALIGSAIIAGLIAVVRLDTWQRLYVLLFLLLAFAASEQEYSNALLFHLRFAAAGLLFAYTCVRYRPRLTWPMTRIHRLFVLTLGVFLVYSTASMVWSSSRGVTLQNLVAGVVIIGTPAIASCSRWRDETTLHSDLRVVYWTILVYGCAGVLYDAVAANESARVSGFFENPNTLADLTAVAFAMGLGLYNASLRRPVYLFSQVLLSVVLMMTQARSGMAAAAIACLWVAVRVSSVAWVRIAVAMVVLSVGTVLVLGSVETRVPTLITSAVERFRPSVATNNGYYTYLSDREQVWQTSLALWREAPMIGHGFRTGESLLQSRREAYLVGAEAPDTTHSGFLQILVESGLIGLSLIIAMFGIVLIARSPQAMRDRTVWLAATSAGAACGAIQSVESSIMGFGGPFAVVLWVVLAAAARLGRSRRT